MIITKEYIASVDPKVHEKYSPNFHKFLSRLPAYLKERGLEFYIRQYKADGESEPGQLTLGYPEKHIVSHTEVRLLNVLCADRMTRNVSAMLTTTYDPDGTMSWTELPGLWEEYQRIGRCAFDPEHRMNFRDHYKMARWDFKSNGHRTCNWCGLQQVIKKIRRVVYDSVWCDKPSKKKNFP